MVIWSKLHGNRLVKDWVADQGRVEPFPIRVEPPRAACVLVELRDESDSKLESGEVENRDA